MAFGLVTVIASAGCQQARNDRLSLGTEVRLPAILRPSPEEARSPADHASDRHTDAIRADDNQSGARRPIAFLVPRDGTVHSSLWRTRFGSDGDHPRLRGVMPTPASALDTSTTSAFGLAFEAIAAPGYAIFDIVALPVRAGFDAFAPPQTSPISLHRRTRQNGWYAIPMQDEHNE